MDIWKSLDGMVEAELTSAEPGAALGAAFEKQYDNRKAPGTNSFPELLYYF